MKKLITLQHTESLHHKNGMIGSWTDWDLSPLGVRQAETIAANLARELKGQEVALYSSDLLRARHAAKILAAHLNVPLICTAALRERNLGEAVGQSVAWAQQHTQGWEKTIDDRSFPGAESRRDTWQRLLPFYEEILKDPHDTVVLVSHGDALSIFNAMWLGLDVEMLDRLDLFGFAGGVSFMERTAEGKHRIRRLSDMSYLK